MMKKLLLNVLLLLTMAIGAVAQSQVTVNDGTSTNSYVPIYGLWVDDITKSQFIIPADDLSEMTGGTISQLSFFSSSTSVSWGSAAFKVYMSETGETVLSSYTPNYSGMTEVYSGSLSINDGGKMGIELSTPFVYTGGNLMIGFEQTASGSYASSSWYGVSQSTNTAIGGYGSNISFRQFLPKITFTYTEGEAPSCARPTNLASSNVGTRAVDLAWTAGAAETAWQLCINGDDQNLVDVTTNPYTLTGLTPETSYSVKVRANCGSEQSYWSNTVSFTTGIACYPPTTLTFTDIALNSANASWTAGASETLWNLQYKKSSDENWTEVNGLTSASYAFAGLEPGTAYNVRVQADCEVESTSAWLTGNFTTSYGIPFLQTFGTTTIPADWSQKSGLLSEIMGGATLSSGSDWYFGTGNGVFDSHARINIYGEYKKGWLLTPSIIMDANVRLTFDLALTAYSGSGAAGTDCADDKFVVLISIDNGATWTILRQYDNAGSEYVYNNIPTAGEEVAINLSSYATDNVVIAFYGESTVSGSDNNLHIDNVRLDYIPSCVRPTAIAISNITPRAATVTWNPGNDETAWQISLNDDEDDVIDVTEATYTFTGLFPESDYTVKVRSNCGGDVSEWTNNVSFRTGIACPAPTALAVSNITAHSATATWTAGAGESEWQVCLEGDEDDLRTVTEPTYTITGLSPESSYTIKVRANCGDYDGVSAWTNTVSYNTTVACPAPADFALASYTPTTATLTWFAGEAESWVLQYGEDNTYALGSFTEVTLTEPTYEITGLTAETMYYARVMANCGDDQESDWSETSFEPTAKVIIGSGTATNSYLPTYIFYNYSMSQQIYTVEEIGTTAGAIMSVDFYTTSTATRNLDVYMIATDKETFSGSTDWITATASDLVYSGSVSFAAGAWTTIEFDSPFIYNGTQNVAIIVDDNTGSYDSSIPFRVFDATAQAIRIYNDNTNYDPTNPGTNSGSVLNVKNQVRLLIGEPPACPKPTALTAANVGGRTATITWNPVGSESAWQVCLNDDEESIIDVTEPTCTITGLSPESDYTVKVRANCGDGVSDWTSNIAFTTLVACPAPTELAANAGLTSAVISWTGHGETAWQLCLNGDEENIIDVTEPSYTMTGLSGASNYSFKVRANCGDVDGQSNWSAVFEFTTALCETEDQCQISYSFTDSYGDGWNGNAINVVDVATGNVIATWTLSTGSSGTGTLAVCNGREISFQWVSGSYSYEASYVVTDVNGDEIFSGSDALETVTYIVNCSSCRMPSNLQANNITVTSAELTWTAGADETDWQLCINNDENNIIDLTATSYEMTGLAEETNYTVKVRANCGAEQSPWLVVNFTTLSACPAPVNLSATTTSNTATVSWEGTSDSYIVRYRISPEQVLFSDDFDNGIGEGWTNIDADDDGYIWVSSADASGIYHNEGVNLSGQGHNSSEGFVISGSFTNYAGIALTPDNWFVTPQISLPQNAESINFRFYASAQDDNYATEHYGVFISTTSATDATAFTQLWAEDMDPDGGPHRGAWGEKNTDLTAYAGQNVYIAIRHFNCTDMFLLNIDDISVTATLEGSAWTEVPADASPAELTGLLSNTTYQYQLVGICGVDDDDNFSAISTFTTLPVTYTITATAGENGSITPNGEVSVVEGTSQAFEIVPVAGYRIASVMVDATEDVTALVVDGVYTFTNVSADHTIYATFEALPTYIISAIANANGTIDPSGDVTVTEGETQAFTITANEGYRIASVMVDGVESINDLVNGVYTFTNVTDDHIISASFEAIPTYTITATAGENGTIDPNGAVTVLEGATQAFTIAANEGYRIASVMVDGVESINDLVNGVYTFTNVTDDHIISASFEAIPTYTITATAGEHGTITPEGAVTVTEGGEQAFVITPDTDYRIDVLTVDGETVALNDAEILGYTYTFNNVVANHTIDVTFTSLNATDMIEAASMAIYPNPNNGMFSIDFSNIEGDAIYQIIDVRGAVVETRDINVMNGATMSFNHNLNPGTYFVRIINGEKVYVEQIVVE